MLTLNPNLNLRPFALTSIELPTGFRLHSKLCGIGSSRSNIPIVSIVVPSSGYLTGSSLSESKRFKHERNENGILDKMAQDFRLASLGRVKGWKQTRVPVPTLAGMLCSRHPHAALMPYKPYTHWRRSSGP